MSESPKPLIIGEQPSKTGDPSKPIEGRIGNRLAEFCGLSYAEYLQTFERTNLLSERAETNGKGSKFNDALARRAAAALSPSFMWSCRTIIILGKRAAKAFGVSDEYFLEQRILGCRTFVVPHPSGVNRWFNDPANDKQMADFMQWLMTTL